MRLISKECKWCERLKREVESLRIEVGAVRDANEKMGQRMRDAEAEVAAAEERGRRRGIEEAIRITESADAFAIPTDPPGKYLKLVCKQLRAALAPRDSAPDPDPVTPYQVPRDSGKDNT